MTRTYRHKPRQGTMFLIGDGFARIFAPRDTGSSLDGLDDRMLDDIGLTRADIGTRRRRLR